MRCRPQEELRDAVFTAREAGAADWADCIARERTAVAAVLAKMQVRVCAPSK